MAWMQPHHMHISACICVQVVLTKRMHTLGFPLATQSVVSRNCSPLSSSHVSMHACVQVFSALQNLHTALVHGDVNAGNIVWDPSGHFFQFVDLEFSTWTTGANAPAPPHAPPLSPPADTPAELQSTPNGRRSRGGSTVSNHSTTHSTSQVFASPAASSKKSWRSPGSFRGPPSPQPWPGNSSRGGEGTVAELGQVGAAARPPHAAAPGARSGGADLARIVSPGLVSWPLTAKAHGSTAAGRLAPHGTLELASFNQLKGCAPVASPSVRPHLCEGEPRCPSVSLGHP